MSDTIRMTHETERLIARCVLEAITPDGYMRADLRLSQLAGNDRPRFSTTADVFRSRGWMERYDAIGSDRGWIMGGALTNEIARAFPKYALVTQLHLADDDGVPMYAEANGWYWYSDYDGKGTTTYGEWAKLTPYERAARYLRLHPSELPEGMTREAFAAFVNAQRGRWMHEATEALRLIRDGADVEADDDNE